MGILELALPLKALEFWRGNFGISPTFEDTRILELEFWNWLAVLAQAWGANSKIPDKQNHS